MLVGQQDKGAQVRSYLRLSQELWSNRLIKNKAFTLVEVLVVTFISLILFSAIFMVLNMGEFQNRIGSTRIDVQQEVRRALDWMIKDLRQTNRNIINVTNASALTFVGLGTPEVFELPDFAICQGFAAGTIVWSPYTINYDLDAPNQTVIRTRSDTGQELKFNHINNLIFTKIGTSTLQIDISGQKVAKSSSAGNITQVFNLTEEIRLRN